jgi:predicted methyltransferase
MVDLKFKRFLRLSAEQMQQVADQCTGLGSYKIRRVERRASVIVVVVEFEDRKRKQIFLECTES